MCCMKNNEVKQYRRPLNAQKPYQKYINTHRHTRTCYWYYKHAQSDETERERYTGGTT